MAAEVPTLSVTVWVALVVLALLMVRGAWRGYRRGPMRQLAGPVALATGQLVGWLFGSDLGHACLQGTSYPWVLRGFTGVVVLTCLTGLACYALFWRLGRQPEGQTEAESPVLGSLVGCWTGLLYFLICVAVLATVASVYDLFRNLGTVGTTGRSRSGTTSPAPRSRPTLRTGPPFLTSNGPSSAKPGALWPTPRPDAGSWPSLRFAP